MTNILLSQLYMGGSEELPPPLVIGIIAIALVIIKVSEIQKKKMREKRRKEMEALAENIGFSFLAQPLEDIPSAFLGFNLFKKGFSKKAKNVLEGSFDNIRLKIFDYQYNTSPGTKNYNQKLFTVFCTYVDDFTLPDFELRQKGFFDKTGDMFGFKDIDFDTHPDFSNRYWLKGSDETEIRRLFSQKVLEYFEKRNVGLIIQGSGDKIIFYLTPPLISDSYNYEIPAEKIPPYYKEVTLIVRILRDAALTF